MKAPFLLTGLALLAPACASAQVVVNPAALQQLAGISAPPPVAAPAPVPVAVEHAPVHHMRKPVAPPAAPTPTPVVAKPPVPAPVKPLTPITVTFAPDSAALPASATAALKPFCAATGHIGINARAPADPNDLSAAMRLSLARAFALRDALIACGVPSQNILPRALGAAPGGSTDDAQIGNTP